MENLAVISLYSGSINIYFKTVHSASVVDICDMLASTDKYSC